MEQLTPFTYYKNEKEQRAWLLVDIEGTETERVIVLIEWGKTREEPQRLAESIFQKLLQNKSLELFTPKYKSHD